MKFILIMQICSALTQQCASPIMTGPEFNSYKECAVFGYTISSEYLEQMNDEKVNSEQIHTKFWCKPSETI